MRGCCNTLNGYFSVFVPVCFNLSRAIIDPHKGNSHITYNELSLKTKWDHHSSSKPSLIDKNLVVITD